MFKDVLDWAFGGAPLPQQQTAQLFSPTCKCGQTQSSPAQYYCVDHNKLGNQTKQTLVFTHVCSKCSELVVIWEWTDIYGLKIDASCRH